METVTVNCRTEFKEAQQHVSAAARELAQRLLIDKNAPPRTASNEGGCGLAPLAAPALPGIDEDEQPGDEVAGAGAPQPLPQVALDEGAARAVQAAARTVEVMGPELVGEIVMGFVRGEASKAQNSQKLLFLVNLCSEYSRTLTFENFCDGLCGWGGVAVLPAVVA